LNGPVIPPARVVFPAEDRRRVLELIDGALASGQLTLGPLTEELEGAFAARHGNPLAVATSSGTSALEIALRAVGVEGQEVIVPVNTFFATAAAVLHAGGRVRFADVDAGTLSLSEKTLAAELTPGVAAAIHVHIGGTISPDVEGVSRLCDEHGVTLIEDAAHAHGSTLDGRPAGTWSAAAAFSFYPTKVVAGAEGGMLLTRDERLRDEARLYRDQGKASFLAGGHVRLGAAWRLSEVQAAVILVHLQRLDEFIAVRRGVAARYAKELAGCPGLTLPPEAPGSRSNYYKYLALLDPGLDRSALKQALREDFGVSLSGEVYATPLHREPIFAGLASADYPIADDVCARHICLPVHSDMTDEEVERVVAAVQTTMARMVSRA
jgi:dTDP-4-amino-4,6-dideoxygalactose transaminase